MHIPDGFLSPTVTLPAWGAAAPLWYWAIRRNFGTSSTDSLPVVGSLTAIAWRAIATSGSRFDLAGEVNLLNLQRDQESNPAGTMERLQASGGTILYAGLGVRAYFGPFSAALAARTSFARWLNEGADQQGSEGLEWVRVALTLSCALPL